MITIIEQLAPKRRLTNRNRKCLRQWKWKKTRSDGVDFYDDANKNNVFDYQEALFNDISVSIRRAGDTQTLRTGAERSGWGVVIDGLAERGL